MRTSGLVLDVYDDFQGEVLRSIYPTPVDIPDNVKIAHPLSHEENSRLPDEVFALVLVNGDQVLRKYACIDEGNTALAVEFFLKTGHKLPAEAQKLAAENLVQACGMYEIEPPEELKKIAFLGAAMNALNGVSALSTVGQAPEQIRQNIEENRAMGRDGHIVTPQERAMMRLSKTADVVGGIDMPLSPTVSKGVTPQKTVIPKTAAGKENCPDDNLEMQHSEQPASLPQAKALKPHIDVTGRSPAPVMKEKKASRYALPSIERYPLDSYTQVQSAVGYFDKYASQMSPDHKREYCANLEKRAAEVGINTGIVIPQYASSDYASEEAIKVGYQVRKNTVSHDTDLILLLDALYEKRASIEPELFAETLSEFDKVAQLEFGYNKGVPDPYISTFGVKVASPWSEIIGNDMVTEQDLVTLGRQGSKSLKSHFDKDFVKEFRKDPVAIFKSLPRDQKIILMRMTNENGPGFVRTA